LSAFARHIAIWSSLSLACLAGLAAFNLALDPFGAYRIVETPVSGYRYLGSRSGKAELLRHLGCQDVLVGTSRTEVGIDPHHPVFDGRVACNAGLANTSMVEVAEVVRVALDQPATERIFLFLDFVMFSSARATSDDFSQSRLAPDRGGLDYHVGNLVSRYATRKSLGMLRFAWRGDAPVYDERGLRVGGPGRKIVMARDLFRSSLDSFLHVNYATYRYGEEHLDRLRRAVAQARKRGVEVVIVIPPVHALQLEAIAASGLWDVFERWKRDLIRIAAEASPAVPAPVWDFTGYAVYNRIPVPADGAPASETPWYWESSHFKVALGDLVLARAAGRAGAEADGPAFGQRLVAEGVDAHLLQLREDRRRYEVEHPDQLAFLREVAGRRQPS